MAKKARVDITGIPAVKSRINEYLSGPLHDEFIYVETGSFIKDQIKKRTQSGADDYAQRPLSEHTVKRREALMRAGNRPDISKIKPKTSALTLSGQLLNAITFEIRTISQEIKFSLLPNRRPYLGVKGKELENNKTNREIKKELEEKQRNFFFLSRSLSDATANFLNKLYRKRMVELGRKRK